MISSSDSCQTSASPSPSTKRSVLECFRAHTGRQIDKWQHYFPIYEKHFAPYVGTPVRVLEIGVDHGGSLQLWKSYFGPYAEIVGIDIDPRCSTYTEPQIDIRIMNQRDPAISRLGTFDIVIDDGSHFIADQEDSFRALWPCTTGVYLVEDCHHGFPILNAPDGLKTVYNWVVVVEVPKRIIRGTPSRELRQDEIAAIDLYSDAQ